MSESLTIIEASRLVTLEGVIESGMRTFIEVGTALCQIRDARLYKSTHTRFEDYCTDRWGMKHSQAYRLIDSAAIAGKLSPNGEAPANESQARPLARLPEAKRQEAWEEAVESAKADGRKVTAADVEEAVERQMDISFLPQGGRVACALIDASASLDDSEHWFMVQEDCRNPGFFYGVHIGFGGTDQDGVIDFTMKPLRAEGWSDSRISPLWKWMQDSVPNISRLEWNQTEVPLDWLWTEYIEPNLPEGMAHLKRKKPVEVETAMQTAGGPL